MAWSCIQLTVSLCDPPITLTISPRSTNYALSLFRSFSLLQVHCAMARISSLIHVGAVAQIATLDGPTWQHGRYRQYARVWNYLTHEVLQAVEVFGCDLELDGPLAVPDEVWAACVRGVRSSEWCAGWCVRCVRCACRLNLS